MTQILKICNSSPQNEKVQAMPGPPIDNGAGNSDTESNVDLFPNKITFPEHMPWDKGGMNLEPVSVFYCHQAIVVV